jgi:AraC-like DNA-binding protein
MTDRQNDLLGKAAVFYLSLLGVFFGVFAVLYWNFAPNHILAYIDLMFAMFNLLWIIFICKYDYGKQIRNFVPLHIVMMLLGIFLNALLLSDINKIAAVVWFFLTPVSAMLFHSYKLAMTTGIISCILTTLVFCLGGFLPQDFLIVLDDKQSMWLNIVTVYLCFVLLFSVCFSMYKIYGTKEIYTEKKIKEATEKTDDHSIANANKAKENKYKFTTKEIATYNKFFAKIEKYFAEQEPYKNNDLTVMKVAAYLNTNILYVARAIKVNRDMNFNTYVNHYRIDFVKMLLDKGDSRKYTMKYIYHSAGFKQQSTFNIVFKQIEGITPSDYLALKEN